MRSTDWDFNLLLPLDKKHSLPAKLGRTRLSPWFTETSCGLHPINGNVGRRPARCEGQYCFAGGSSMAPQVVRFPSGGGRSNPWIP